MVPSGLEGAIAPEEAVTLDGLLRERVARTPDAVAYRDFNQQHANWRDYTWAHIYHHAGRFQAALEREGLQPGDRVALMLRNSPEWVVYDQATLGLGLVVVPLHMQDGADNVAYILRDAGCKVLLVGSLKHWRALEKTCAGVESLQRVVTVESFPEGEASDARVRALDQWLPDGDAPAQHRARDPQALATIIYTSGTTGRPKGVMLSHRNILTNACAGLRVLDLHPNDELLSFLPLSHAFERTCGYYLTMMMGITVAYARSIQQLGEDLRTVRPTALMSVPRVYEMVYAAIRCKLEEGPAYRRRLFELAVKVGYARFEHRQGRAPWRISFLLWPLLDALVARKVRARLGGRLRHAFSGGAALPPRIARIFIGFGINIIQGYGLTETSPIACANHVDDNVPASIGLPIPGVEVRLDAGGALLIRGPNIMLGYWNNPAATAAVIDRDGWFNSGDIAKIDAAGHVYITGRLKEILVMSNGEKIPPGDIEAAILRDPLFSQVMLVGEGKPYLALLAVLDREQWGKAARAKNLGDDLTAKAAHAELLTRIAAQVKEFPIYGHVRRVTATFEPWTIESGLLTPTLKLRRTQVLEHYRAEFEKMYAGFEVCKDAPL
ncbi:MAG TPA: long-chain fatty acid--CoA ligase [Burkholderiales bacterium]|nr:long-chain fatty acid--CoA ligase [Burkholderiales bacterium]